MDLTPLRQIDLFRNLDAIQLSHLASISSERTAKYNQLLRIEEELGETAIFGGKEVFYSIR